MKKAIFFGLFFGLATLLGGFWLGFQASTPEVEISVTVEETLQMQSESPTRGVTPKSAQISRPIFARQEEEEPQEPKTEVVQSETQKKLAELGFSTKKLHKISTK